MLQIKCLADNFLKLLAWGFTNESNGLYLPQMQKELEPRIWPNH